MGAWSFLYYLVCLEISRSLKKNLRTWLIFLAWPLIEQQTILKSLRSSVPQFKKMIVLQLARLVTERSLLYSDITI